MSELSIRPTSMVTYSGRYIDLLAPTPSDVSAADIAHHLASINRYSGATIRPLSLAEHSLLCVSVARHVLGVTDPVVQLCVLLDDAYKAYLQEDITPMRRAMEHLSPVSAVTRMELRGRFHRAIGEHYRITSAREAARDVIKQAALIALATERRDLIAEQAEDWSVLAGAQPAVGMNLRAHDSMTWKDWKCAWLDVLLNLQFSITDRREQLYGSGTPPRP